MYTFEVSNSLRGEIIGYLSALLKPSIVKVNYEIVEMQQFSGSQSKVYSILPDDGTEQTLFEQFVDENVTEFRSEIKEILRRLKQIGHSTGARESFFKHEGDKAFVGKYGRCVWALYDDEERKLRLYCVRFANVAIILGGGGYKDKAVIKWQDDEKLSQEVRKVMTYAECIFKQLEDRDLYWSKDGTSLEGNFKNYDNE